MNQFMPERKYPAADFSTEEKIESAINRRTVLSASPYRCDPDATLHFRIDGVECVMTSNEVAYPNASYASACSCVGKRICFIAVGQSFDKDDNNVVYLSRAAVQKQYTESVLDNIELGTVLPCIVTKNETFGSFCDIGCGVSALLRKARISVSRVPNPSIRLSEGDEIYAIAASKDESGRISLSMKELLGTWEQNACDFSDGDVVTGVVRGIKEYGAFIELAPNLCGLSENYTDLQEGDRVSARISHILPEKMKIKLYVLAKLDSSNERTPLRYFVKDGVIKKWKYSPDCCAKVVEVNF